MFENSPVLQVRDVEFCVPGKISLGEVPPSSALLKHEVGRAMEQMFDVVTMLRPPTTCSLLLFVTSVLLLCLDLDS